MENGYAVLKRVFGHASFRSFQEDAVDAILARLYDVMMILPTELGSLFAINFLLDDGRGIAVISPLLALMHDQVTALYGIASSMISSM